MRFLGTVAKFKSIICIRWHSTTPEIPNSEVVADQCQALAALVARHTEPNGNLVYPTAITPLSFSRSNASSAVIYQDYEPRLAILVQGKKDIVLGEETYPYEIGQCLVVSVDLPIGGCIVEATTDQPYLGLKLTLDPMQLCEMAAQMNFSSAKKENSVRGLFVSNADATLLDCALRLTKLLDTPQDIPMLAPMMIRELYYRLLMGEQSEAVRQIATSGSSMQRIASAIKQINQSRRSILKGQGQRVGYVRVSSPDQKLDRQLENVDLDKYFTDMTSGKDAKRPGLEAMLSYVREGDTLVVHSMDRLARNLDDLRRLVQQLTARGIRVEFIKESLTFTSEDSPMANLLLSVMGAVAEFERELHRERQREGIALARQSGNFHGRRKALSPDQAADLRQRASKGEPKTMLAREFGISRETLYQYLRDRSLDAQVTESGGIDALKAGFQIYRRSS